MIETLTLEQRQQLSHDRRKARKRWNQMLRLTQPIDRGQATVAIVQVYAHLGLSAPRILFFPSPDAAWNSIQRKLYTPTRLLRQVSIHLRQVSIQSI
ncbi:hypothetical protein H6F67_20735 [Microcoleus sp. FACHB-1515]|uniref:hypothetical protein n=1 Tax=Cyanophyceae TaxID=3028117 RepID=UPI001683B860|nr:hypothetical protein [Microcoleus sp. FACHB-1515]MBD2092279.1 hypothetical protein [Microcoleus sp. FACHB-1515]